MISYSYIIKERFLNNSFWHNRYIPNQCTHWTYTLYYYSNIHYHGSVWCILHQLYNVYALWTHKCMTIAINIFLFFLSDIVIITFNRYCTQWHLAIRCTFTASQKEIDFTVICTCVCVRVVCIWLSVCVCSYFLWLFPQSFRQTLVVKLYVYVVEYEYECESTRFVLCNTRIVVSEYKCMYLCVCLCTHTNNPKRIYAWWRWAFVCVNVCL